MASQYETVTITVGGVNPQTTTVQVLVDPTTGVGTATFSYAGTNGGSDTIQATATIAGSSYTSNSAQVNWQSSNGAIQLDTSNTTCYAWGDSPHSGKVANYIWSHTGSNARNITTSGVQSKSNNSLAFDAYRSVGNGDDPEWSTFNSAGTATGYVSWPPYTEDFNCIILANLLIPAGTYTLSALYKDSILWGIGPSLLTGASLSWTGMGTLTGVDGQTGTANSNYPLLSCPTIGSGEGGYTATGTNSVTCSQSSVYPIEVNWAYWYHTGRVMHITSNSAEVAPVNIISVPAASTPTGNLTITPAGGVTNWQLVDQSITLSINVSGIMYQTISYVPVFEGVTGSLNVYNDSTNDVFNLQTYNGQAVSKTAVISSNVLSLSSTDNTAYQGLFSMGYDGTNFNLNYNGTTANSSINSHVLSTNLVVTAPDIAWYNSTSSSFDLFGVSGSSGGISSNIEVMYMNKPSLASISPTTISANGESNTLSIFLSKSLSPQQQGDYDTGNTVICSCSIAGASTTGTPSAVLDSSGWLTGWTVPFTAPFSTTNTTLDVNLSVTGVLTYLSGNTFITNDVTYISGIVGTIAATGSSYTAPIAQGLSISPAGPTYSISDGTTSFIATVTAQVFVLTSNSTTCTFTQDSDSTTQTVLGTGTLQSSVSTTVGGSSGYLRTYTLTLDFMGTLIPMIVGGSIYGGTVIDYLGFNVVDNVSGLTCSYTSTTKYTINYPNINVD